MLLGTNKGLLKSPEVSKSLIHDLVTVTADLHDFNFHQTMQSGTSKATNNELLPSDET